MQKKEEKEEKQDNQPGIRNEKMKGTQQFFLH